MGRKGDEEGVDEIPGHPHRRIDRSAAVIRKQPWFERQFPTALPAEHFPVVVERLRGTPARLEERLQSLPTTVLTRRSGETWSIQENAGHLLDLEPLWLQRGEDFPAGRAGGSAAATTPPE